LRLSRGVSRHLSEQNETPRAVAATDLMALQSAGHSSRALRRCPCELELDDEVMRRIDQIMIGALPVAGPSPETAYEEPVILEEIERQEAENERHTRRSVLSSRKEQEDDGFA